jgi:hypothetical protein
MIKILLIITILISMGCDKEKLTGINLKTTTNKMITDAVKSQNNNFFINTTDIYCYQLNPNYNLETFNLLHSTLKRVNPTDLFKTISSIFLTDDILCNPEEYSNNQLHTILLREELPIHFQYYLLNALSQRNLTIKEAIKFTIHIKKIKNINQQYVFNYNDFNIKKLFINHYTDFLSSKGNPTEQMKLINIIKLQHPSIHLKIINEDIAYISKKDVKKLLFLFSEVSFSARELLHYIAILPSNLLSQLKINESSIVDELIFSNYGNFNAILKKIKELNLISKNTTNNGNTWLHVAAKYGDHKLVRKLKIQGLKDKFNTENKTAFDLAILNKYYSLAKIIDSNVFNTISYTLIKE